MPIIEIKKIYKDYGNQKGVFDVTLSVDQGEVFGYLGPNGAGKTVTIRAMLGFIKPNSGEVFIEGASSWKNPEIVNANIGYLPGEIYFPKSMTGIEFLKWSASMKGTKNLEKAYELLDELQLNPNIEVKKMSKGMKQKLGIVNALMHDCPILILDEPTNGLDPLMQETFVNIINREKKAGKTIFMSSHMFSEVEKTCDKVAIIKQGEIIAQVDIEEFKKPKVKTYEIKYTLKGEAKKFYSQNMQLDYVETMFDKNKLFIRVKDENITDLLRILSNYNIAYLSEIKMTLEDFFMKFYSNKTEGEQTI